MIILEDTFCLLSTLTGVMGFLADSDRSGLQKPSRSCQNQTMEQIHELLAAFEQSMLQEYLNTFRYVSSKSY